MRPLSALAAALLAACAAPPIAQLERPSPGIRAAGTPVFLRKTSRTIGMLRRTRCGARLLGELAETGRETTVREGSQHSTASLLQALGGGDSVIAWDPDFDLPGNPAFLILYHELVHALHEARGARLAGIEEERKTVGLEAFSGYELSENALRRELGMRARRALGWEEFPEHSPYRR